MPSATQGRRPQIDEFELLGELGRGGLSTVHVAVSLDTGRRVALKRVQLPRPDGARASAFLADLTGATPAHPGALRPLAAFVHEEEPWLVLRLMAGGSLRRYAGLVSPVQAARVLASVLDVLHAAGRRGIAHADLKPENILLGPRGAVTVADFGLVAAHERARRCVVWGTRMATPAYMAPEQALGARATPAADLFAVGAVAYELLTGRPPMSDGEPLEELVRRRAQAPAPRLATARPDLDARLSGWVDGLMAHVPEDRPSDAAEARAQLEEIVADVHGAGWREAAALPPAPPAGEESPMPPPAQRLAELPVAAVTSAPQAGASRPAPAGRRQRTLRRHPVAAWIALGLLVIAGAVAGAVMVLRSGSEPAPRTRSTAATAAAPLAASEYRRRGNAICAGQPALQTSSAPFATRRRSAPWCCSR